MEQHFIKRINYICLGMEVYAIYINIGLSLVAFLQYFRAILQVSKIQYKLDIGDEFYQWIDDLSLHRLVLKMKIGFRLIMSTCLLTIETNQLYPVVLPYRTSLITYVTLLLCVCMAADAILVYLIYTRSNFDFLKIIIKIKKNANKSK
jgi:hypothetical protein